mmetsp:Transcript_38309/g.113588  ORF Transcript_38309/g.113588 Transcript_38309/m.113588 type:complete len:80 (+) Transcript_38309:247-486(+)
MLIDVAPTSHLSVTAQAGSHPKDVVHNSSVPELAAAACNNLQQRHATARNGCPTPCNDAAACKPPAAALCNSMSAQQLP